MKKSLTFVLLSLLAADHALAGCQAEAVIAADAITVALQAPGRTEILVEFDAGAATLTRNGLAQLRELSETLREQPDLRLGLQIVSRSESGAALAAERERALVRELNRLDVRARQYQVRSHGPAELAAFENRKSGS
jgi:hypothetical protein